MHRLGTLLVAEERIRAWTYRWKKGCMHMAEICPHPSPKNASPVCCNVKPYWVRKIHGIPPKKRYNIPDSMAAQVSRASTMYCVVISTKGVLSELLRACRNDRLSSSLGARYRSSPVSLRILHVRYIAAGCREDVPDSPLFEQDRLIRFRHKQEQ